ncbi:RAS guanyl-releasing protein 2-like [Clavelina lepadiformis]|uniref:RAS guanyl-releasing protein 2-like n=1 Tax=Clavelina lepadiformis TaxID=159417 RepID=UPI004042FB21
MLENNANMPSSLFQRISHRRGSSNKLCDDTGAGKKFHRRRSTSSLPHNNEHCDIKINKEEVADLSRTRTRSYTSEFSRKFHRLSPRVSKKHVPTSPSPLSSKPTLPDQDNLSPAEESGKSRHHLRDIAFQLISVRKRSSSIIATSTGCKNGYRPVCRSLSLAPTPRLARNMALHNVNGTSHRSVTANGDVTNTTPRDEESNHPASVESLVRKCAECFDNDGKCSNEGFPRLLFLTHLWFMTSEQLMVLFSQLYEEEKIATSDFHKRVFYAIRFWLHEFPHMFDLDQALVRALQNLQKESENDREVDPSVIDLSNKNSYKWMSEAHLSIRPNQVNRKRRKVSLVFNHLEPAEIAIHMSYLEYKSFRRLTLSDFHNYAVHGAIKDNLKLERVVFLFNNITHWVQCMILDHHNPQERAVSIVKFVEIAKKLFAMRNFNTLMAVVGALTHTAIARLKKTMANVPKDTLKTLEEFVELLDSKANYTGYRRAYQSINNEFKIPVIGVLMKDLIALHAAYPDRVGDGLINVRKMNLIGGIFQELIGIQRFTFPYEVNRDLVNTLRVSLYLYYSEEEIYQLSSAREPRDVKYSTSGSTPVAKPLNMGFAEFTRYTCLLDRKLIKQHVTAMVASVFKAYDQNSDGFISEAEFESFIKNFPGLDSFAIVDMDRDGKISMQEMVDYFLKISSTRRNEVCQSFKHDFSETNYFHPTFCEECGRLLWGLMKQGWKCKDCGINCHKHCKDRIVQECRQKPNSKNGNSATNSLKKSEKPTEKSSSISSESDFSINGDLTDSRKNSTFEDEAFELQSPKLTKASDVKRSISLAAADVTSGSSKLYPGDNRRAKSTSKTPPPDRKSSTSTLPLDGSRISFQRKMQNILKKKTSSKRLGHNTWTQTAENSAPPSPYSARLPTVGDNEGEETRLKIPDTNGKGSSFLSVDRHTNCNRHHISQSTNSINFGERVTVERRDSGLSDCSCLTASASAPATPMYFEKNIGITSFLYPVTPSTNDSKSPSPTETCSSGVSDLSLSSRIDTKSLLEENDRLRSENEQLSQKLKTSHEKVAELEAKLGHYSKST